MKRAKIIAWATIIVSIVVATASLLIASPSESPAAFHVSLFLSLIITVVQIGAASQFLLGLKGFKHELRVAYGIICAGIVALGLSNLQLPIVSYFDLSESLYVTSGIIAIPYIAPALLVYFGERQFAKLFQLKIVWMSFWFVMGLALLCAVLMATLGGLIHGFSNTELMSNLALSAWTAIFLLASALIVVRVRHTAGVLYHDALLWFVAARVVVAVTGFSYIALVLFIGDKSWLYDYGVILVPSAVSALLFLHAGYLFRLINEDHVIESPREDISMIDVVTFAASQASNPSEIDHALNRLRAMTAGLSEGERTLTAKQQDELRQVYSDIELYLVEKEPLRRLTSEDVRRKGATYFGVNYNTFVEMVAPAQTSKA